MSVLHLAPLVTQQMLILGGTIYYLFIFLTFVFPVFKILPTFASNLHEYETGRED